MRHLGIHFCGRIGQNRQTVVRGGGPGVLDELRPTHVHVITAAMAAGMWAREQTIVIVQEVTIAPALGDHLVRHRVVLIGAQVLGPGCG